MGTCWGGVLWDVCVACWEGFLSCAGVESLPLGVCFVGVLGVYVFLIINVSLIEVLCEGA